MKVLWLASWYPTKLSPFNGDFIQRHAQAVSIFAQVVVIHVVKDETGTITNDIKVEESANGNLSEKIIYYRSKRTGIRILDKFLSHRKYTNIYRREIAVHFSKNGNPNIVHVNVAMKAGLVALWIKRKFKIPFVLTEHWAGYYQECVPNIFNQDALVQKMTREVFQETDLFLPVTADLGLTINDSFTKVKYEVVQNVVNTDHFFLQQNNDGYKFRFIHPSSLNFQKNPKGILAACKILKDKGINFEFIFIGNKDDSLALIASESGLSNEVVFYGMIPNSDVAKQMQNASALVLFSRFENLPCVILEALCCGLPVISSNVGGISEVVDSSNGIVVENENVQQLATAMQQMIENYLSYDREKIAKVASSKFNYQTIGMQYLEKYQALKVG